MIEFPLLQEGLAELFPTSSLPSLGPDVRSGRISLPKLTALFKAQLGSMDVDVRRKVESASLLWNDHLDESHSLSQSMSDSDGGYLHGIMHRREPDYFNAKYWFRRVGAHPVCAALRVRVGARGSAGAHEKIEGWFSGNQFDPAEFVDLCEKAARGKNASLAKALTELQAVEILELVRSFFPANEGG